MFYTCNLCGWNVISLRTSLKTCSNLADLLRSQEVVALLGSSFVEMRHE